MITFIYINWSFIEIGEYRIIITNHPPIIFHYTQYHTYLQINAHILSVCLQFSWEGDFYENISVYQSEINEDIITSTDQPLYCL